LREEEGVKVEVIRGDKGDVGGEDGDIFKFGEKVGDGGGGGDNIGNDRIVGDITFKIFEKVINIGGG
jgi:hypothetical protein